MSKFLSNSIVIEGLIKVAEFGSGFLAWYVYSLATEGKHDVPFGLDWIVGALVTIGLLVIDIAIRVNRLTEAQAHGAAKLKTEIQQEMAKAAERETAAITKLAKLIDQQSDNGLVKKALSYANRELSPADTQSVWAELMDMARRSYRATNYIEPKSFYGSGKAQSVLLLQKTKLRLNPTNFNLQKVLIWDTQEERDSGAARKIVEEHQNDKLAQMHLRGILHRQITQDGKLSQILRDELGGQIDFAVFDEKVVLIWHLNAAREITGSEVLESPVRVEAFLKFFKHLFESCESDGL